MKKHKKLHKQKNTTRSKKRSRKDPRPITSYVLPNLPLAAPTEHEHALYREHAALHKMRTP